MMTKSPADGFPLSLCRCYFLIRSFRLPLNNRELGRHGQDMWTDWLLFQCGWLAGALPNVRTRGLYSKTPIPILRVPALPLENLTFFPKPTLQFCFVLKRKPCLQITPGFTSSSRGGTPRLTGECRGKNWASSAQRTLLLCLWGLRKASGSPAPLDMRLAYQEASAVPHPTGEFCHFQVLSRWLRQAGHSGGQKRKPIFATRLSHIPTRPGALTSFSKYPSLSHWFKIHAKKKKSDMYWFLRPPNRNIFLGFVWFGIFCSFVLFHLVLFSFLFSGLFSIKPILCFVGRKFPIWRQHPVEIEGADRPPPQCLPNPWHQANVSVS